MYFSKSTYFYFGLKHINRCCARHPNILYSNVEDWWFVDLLHVHRPFTLSYKVLQDIFVWKSVYIKKVTSRFFSYEPDILYYWKHHIRAEELIPFDRNKWKFGLIIALEHPKASQKKFMDSWDHIYIYSQDLRDSKGMEAI